MSSDNHEFIKLFNKIDFENIHDHPNILIAARFWDDERYEAARTCYKFMRAIDDLIDGHKAQKKIIRLTEKEQFLKQVDEWIGIIVNSDPSDSEQEELIQTMKKFKIPVWSMQYFAKSMIYDINNNGFPTMEAFRKYAEGASIAPASIFVHLCGLKQINGHYILPGFNVKRVASSCAIFSYLVHIIRDFQKDQKNNLNYFADDLLAKHRLTVGMLNDFAKSGEVDSNFRNLIREYYKLADQYRIETYSIIEEIKPGLSARYRLSLEIIFSLYLMVFERIDVEKGKFTTEEMTPTPQDIKERVYSTINSFCHEKAIM